MFGAVCGMRSLSNDVDDGAGRIIGADDDAGCDVGARRSEPVRADERTDGFLCIADRKRDG